MGDDTELELNERYSYAGEFDYGEGADVPQPPVDPPEDRDDEEGVPPTREGGPPWRSPEDDRDWRRPDDR